MQIEAEDRLWSLVDRSCIHTTGIPVDLTALEDFYPVRRRDLHLAGLIGFTSTQIDGSVLIVLDDRLGDHDTRLAYTHEIGHILHGHSGSLRAIEVNEWFHDHQEREAWEVAAALLIPLEEVAKHHEWSVSSIAALCEVPEWLVRLHLDMV